MKLGFRTGITMAAIATQVPDSLRQMFERVDDSLFTGLRTSRLERNTKADRSQRKRRSIQRSKTLVSVVLTAGISLSAVAEPAYYYVYDLSWLEIFPDKYLTEQDVWDLCPRFHEILVQQNPTGNWQPVVLTRLQSGAPSCYSKLIGGPGSEGGWATMGVARGGCPIGWTTLPDAPDKIPADIYGVYSQYCVPPPPVPPPPPAPPPTPLGCASGDGGFTSCPGDSGVPYPVPIIPPPAPPLGMPTAGGPSPNLGDPSTLASPGPTSVVEVSNTCRAAEAVGDPVFPGTGGSFQQEVDYIGPSGLTFVRRYNSLLPGWVQNYSIRVLANASLARVVRPDGRSHEFTGSGPGEWVPEIGTPEKLIRLSPTGAGQATWRYVNAEDGVELYDEGGRLMSITVRGGKTFTAQQSGGLLRSITDPYGRSLLFGYDSANRLSQFTTPGGAVTTFWYDIEGRLGKVTRPDGTTRRYQYLSTPSYLPLGMTAIIDEAENYLATWTYDNRGRVTSTEQSGGINRHTFVYDYRAGATLHKDPLGTFRIQNYSWAGPKMVYVGQDVPCTNCFGDAAGKSIDQTSGMLNESVDFLGISTLFTNDNQRKLPLSITKAAGRPEQQQQTIDWHPVYRLPVRITEAGRTTEYVYDANGNVLNQTITDSATSKVRTWAWSYNLQGLVETATDPSGGIQRYTYDNAGNQVSSKDALGNQTTFTYDADGRVIGKTDPNGLATAIAYDLRGRVVTINRGGEITSFAYAPIGKLAQVTQPDGYQVNYNYDTAQRLRGITDNRGSYVSYVLDNMGNRTSESVGPAGPLIRRLMNAQNQVIKEELGFGGQGSRFSYDGNGRLVGVNDPFYYDTTTTLDGLGRPVATYYPDNGSSSQAWNAFDQLTGVTDPKGIQTTYQTNAFGEVIQETSPDIGTRVMQRDAAGRVSSVTDGNGSTVQFERDALGRPTVATYSDQAHVFTYDAIGNVTRAEDKSGKVSYTYDSLGRVVLKSQYTNDNTSNPTRLDVAYSHVNGNLAGMTYPSGLKVTYDRTAGRITGINVQEPGGTVKKPKAVIPFVSGLQYNGVGLPYSWSWASGDAASRELGLEAGVVVSTEFASYQYDGALRITGITQNLWASRTVTQTVGSGASVVTELYQTPLTWAASYDARGRLTKLARDGDSTTYAYDRNSNIVKSTESKTSDTDLDGDFDDDDLNKTTERVMQLDPASNRLLGYTETTTKTRNNRARSVVTAPVVLSQDAAGSRTSDGLRMFEYDAAGRTSKVEIFKDGEAASVQYLTNALGQRVFKSEPKAEQTLPSEDTLGTGFVDWLKRNFKWLFLAAQSNASIGTLFVYDEAGNLLGEYDNGSASGKGRTEYIWLPMENGTAMPIGFYRNGKFFAVHADHLGTPRLVTDESNKPVWQWPYGTFGNNKPTGVLKATPKPVAAITNQPVLLKATNPVEMNLRFPGQYFDAETNLHYNYFRDYDSKNGRYTQADPLGLGGGESRFAYVAGNPLTFFDPTGLDPMSDRIAGIPSGRAIDLLSKILPTGNLSGNIPIRGLFGVSYSCKVNGETGDVSFYLGAGLVMGSSFSFAPRVSPQLSAAGGDTSGPGYRLNISTPGFAGPFGATSSISGTAKGGVTVQGGPAVSGGQPSISATLGYTFKR